MILVNLVFLMVMPYPFIWMQNLVKFTKTMGHNNFLQFSQKDQNGCKRFCNSTLHICCKQRIDVRDRTRRIINIIVIEEAVTRIKGVCTNERKKNSELCGIQSRNLWIFGPKNNLSVTRQMMWLLGKLFWY